MASEWVTWQLIDSAFPSGGFAHSGGLESALQWGMIRDHEALVAYFKTNLTQLGHSSVPFVTASHREPARITELDVLCDAFLSNHVANRASRLQGQGFLMATEAAFDLEICTSLRACVRRNRFAGHLPPVFGAVAAALDIPLPLVVRQFLYLGLRDLTSSAVRLNVLGPLQGQSTQFKMKPFLEQLAQQSVALDIENVAQTAPVSDLLQQTHDRLYSRLFQS